MVGRFGRRSTVRLNGKLVGRLGSSMNNGGRCMVGRGWGSDYCS